MKYRIIAKKTWNFGRYELRYFPQVYARRWYWPWKFWVMADSHENGHCSEARAEEACKKHNSEARAEEACKEHNRIGVRKEFEL